MKPNEQAELLLTQYLDGELSADESLQFEARLQSSATLQAELRQRVQVRNQLRSAVQQVEVPESALARVLEHTARPARFRIPGAWRNLQLAGALAFVLLLFVAGWQILRMPQYSLDDLPQPVAAVLRIGIGKHVSCVKERVNASMFALGTYSSEVDAEHRAMLDAAQSALPGDFRVVERHICGSEHRKFAHLVLEKDNFYLSILITPRQEGDADLPSTSYAVAEVDGMQIYAVREDGLSIGAFALPTQYAFVVSDSDDVANLGFSKSVAGALGRHH